MRQAEPAAEMAPAPKSELAKGFLEWLRVEVAQDNGAGISRRTQKPLTERPGGLQAIPSVVGFCRGEPTSRMVHYDVNGVIRRDQPAFRDDIARSPKDGRPRVSSNAIE